MNIEGRSEPSFPTPRRIKGRLYFLRSEVEAYKAKALAHALGSEPVAPPPPPVDSLVPAKVIAEELGFGRRTLGRRLIESGRASRNAEAA